MEENKHESAENILADDSLSEDLINNQIAEGEFEKEELCLAENIRHALGSPKATLSKDQKEILGNRITEQINRSKRNKTIAWISSAAILLVAIGLSFFISLQRQSNILIFASKITIPQSDFTQLILSDKETVQIDAQESRIAYSGTGKEVKIDEEKIIAQEVDRKKLFNTVIVPYGKRSLIKLSDNSTVWLNSGSKLVYPVCFDDDKREVFLDGEALFDVTPNRMHPFHVLTSNMKVKVLGTVFDVCAYSDDNVINTVLERGSIELIYKNQSFFGSASQRMVPGMLASYDPESRILEQKNVNTKNYTSWKDGYLLMEKKSLESLVKKLSRYYNVDIQIEH